MDIHEIGLLQVFAPNRGLNKDTLGTEYRKAKLEFTKKAIKAYNVESKKKATILIPITNVAFSANGKSQSMWEKFVKSLVYTAIGDSNKENYKIDSYQSLRNQLK